MSRAIVLYLHVHQPYRLRHYTIFDAGVDHNYFDSPPDTRSNNTENIHKVSEKSYLPTNKILLDLLHKYPEFHLNLSLTGTVIEQFERWAPETLQSFKDLVATGRVEILAETYYHSLAFFYSKEEFELQVEQHRQKIESVFGQTPTVFRNTELAYNNDLAYWADKAGYKGILAEGWDKFLDWRSPNFVYRPKYTDNIRLLMKNYHLSDDIAFRFCDHDWKEWPLTASKFCHWLDETKDGTNFNLFMDYETFGEHQWVESGIFDFLKTLPGEWLKNSDNSFMTISQAIEAFEPVGEIDIPETVTWADTERDLSAWLGNPMQQEAIKALYDLRSGIISTGDPALIEDWRRLQTADHFYYMCTKWFNDGDIHAYFNPYDTPYVGFINYMNAWHDLRFRLSKLGVGL
jgi:alpha-amylase